MGRGFSQILGRRSKHGLNVAELSISKWTTDSVLSIKYLSCTFRPSKGYMVWVNKRRKSNRDTTCQHYILLCANKRGVDFSTAKKWEREFVNFSTVLKNFQRQNNWSKLGEVDGLIREYQ